MASTLPFLKASVAAFPFKASALTSLVLNPFDSKINLASTYVPEPGSSKDTLFPFKSFTELILLFFKATKWICS